MSTQSMYQVVLTLLPFSCISIIASYPHSGYLGNRRDIYSGQRPILKFLNLEFPSSSQQIEQHTQSQSHEHVQTVLYNHPIMYILK